MKNMHSEWRGRVDHWVAALKKDLYLPLGPIPVESFLTMEQLSPGEALSRDFQPMPVGTAWGRTYEYCWMRAEVVLPEAAAGERVAMDLNTGGETTIFVDGKSFGTYRADWVAEPYHFIVDNYLTTSGVPGRKYDILLEAYAGHFYPESPLGGCSTGPVLPGTYTDPKVEGRRAVLGNMTYGIWNEDAYQLLMDVETLRILGDQVDPDGMRAEKIADALEQFTLIVDFEQPLEGRRADYRAAREALRPALEARNGTSAPEFYAVGNAHLDLAWLWPMEETYRKTSRTFAAQLRLLEEYPEYKFIQSQPASYEMCRKYYPELYARIKKAVKDGSWLVEGAMYVEPDTNMTSGESLVRQLLYGKQFFKEEFDLDSEILWLPDTFGYSAALPQILNGCGVKYLVTQKIFWSYNEGEQFPYHYFTWAGADGSKIDTFLPTSYTYRTDPKEFTDTWKKRAQKRKLDAFLFPFGYGDGGGGPCRDHIEYLRREKDLEGMPRVRVESPTKFFKDMEAAGGPKNTYVGELYFTAHRGVFTSQALVKRGNRKSEIALREAEMWGAVAMLKGQDYPRARMDEAWKLLLLNQFHDILPGSGMGKIYEKTHREHRRIISEAEMVRDEALFALTEGTGVTVFNSLSFPRAGVVSLPDEFALGAETPEGDPVPVQNTDSGVLAYVTVPPCGAVSLVPAVHTSESGSAEAFLIPEGAVLQNNQVCAVFNTRGEMVSFVRKDEDQNIEFAAGPMNRLMMFKDVPRKFDAWDIDSNYILQPVAIDEPVTLTVKESGGLRASLNLKRKILNSTFEQDIVLEAGSIRVDFVTHVDWRELHRLLKVSFPVAVQATEGINEIQYGYMTRPTHRSRLYDSDRFEVCNQRYSALVDSCRGAAVLNDCKYGISMNGSALELTLLRAAAAPEMRADNGEHDFTYAFTAWEGSFFQSPVVDEAYDLNVPLQVFPGSAKSFSALDLKCPNVYIDAVKPAQDGSGDVIVRLYESKRADTTGTLEINIPARRVWQTDMLENRQAQLPLKNGRVELHFHTFEVKTLRIEP